MLLLHHYANKSVDSWFDGTMPIYDGNDYYIPPFHSVVLVPCNSDDPDHLAPSIDSCHLLTGSGIQTAEKVPMLIMYLIENTSNVGLLLKNGDLLGASYTGPHAYIKAERSYMLIDNYRMLVDEQNNYCFDDKDALNYETMDEEDEITTEEPTLDEVVLMSFNKDVTDAVTIYEKL
jgi:hypothetical protein